MELIIYLNYNDNAIIVCGFYKHFLEFQGLIGYYICIFWSSKDWMGIVYAFFWVIGIKNFGWILGFFKKQLCSTLALIHIKKFTKPLITAKNGILVSPLVVGTFFSDYYKHLVGSGPSLSFDYSQVVLTLCSLKLLAPMFACLELYRFIYWVP
jgi:hypothetical protein